MTLSKDLINKAETVVLDTLLRAQDQFKVNFEIPKIEWVDMGVTAGKALSGSNLIKLSPTLFSENVSDFLSDTIPHEIAHLVTRKIYQANNIFHRVKSHGPEWRHVMYRLGIPAASRCHSYDTSQVSNARPRPYLFKCACQEFRMTELLFKKIYIQKQRRWCLKCKVDLVFVRKES